MQTRVKIMKKKWKEKLNQNLTGKINIDRKFSKH